MKFLIVVIVLFSCFAYADRTVWYVHPDSALNSIQAGLDSCVDNDIVLVGPGTYFENLIWPNTQGIHLISELGSENTIINGDSAGTIIFCNAGIDTMTVINGFTLMNAGDGCGIDCGENSSPIISNNIIKENLGAGIDCTDNSDPIIRNNIIKNNSFYFLPRSSGGGIYCNNSNPIIINNTIRNNVNFEGGGISCWLSSPNIVGNTIIYNRAVFCFGSGGDGGGIYIEQGSPLIINNLITQNCADTFHLGQGGGIYARDCGSVIRGNTITNNKGNFAGAGLHCCGNQSPVIDSCTFLDNDFIGVYSHGNCNPVINNCNLSNNGYSVWNDNQNIIVNAEFNWWGHATGPYHPDSNPAGQGDTVSDYVDFIPWLHGPYVKDVPALLPNIKDVDICATIQHGPLQLPKEKRCKVFDITGREVKPHLLAPGIYFIEVDGVVTQKVVKIR